MSNSSAAIEILKGVPPNPQKWQEFRGKTQTNRVDGLDLEGVNLAHYDFNNMQLPKLRMKNCCLEGASFSKAQIEGAEFSSCAMRGVRFSHAHLSGARFSGSELVQADFNSAQCNGARFLNCNIGAAGFPSADLTDADFTGASARVGTNFQSATVTNCRMDRHTLESLGDHGKLTPGQLMDMEIVDGVATLRASYSGFLQWIHVSALIIFAFPYAYFVFSRWALARFASDGDGGSIALYEAFARYIWNGGANWESGFEFNFSFIAFVYSCSYNVLRLVLLWKTKALELEQAAKGVPVKFTLAGIWGRAFDIARIGFWLNLLIVAYHTLHFMGQQIPIPNV